MPHDREEIITKGVIEIPRGSFLKRGWSGHVDFVSPLPCPFNYGAVPDYIGGEGDLLDAVVLGPRLPRGKMVTTVAQGAVGLTDRGMYDDKLICHDKPLSQRQKQWILFFFHVYGIGKRLLNFYRRRPGPTYCNGWGRAQHAFARAVPRQQDSWNGPEVPF